MPLGAPWERTHPACPPQSPTNPVQSNPPPAWERPGTHILCARLHHSPTKPIRRTSDGLGRPPILRGPFLALPILFRETPARQPFSGIPFAPFRPGFPLVRLSAPVDIGSVYSRKATEGSICKAHPRLGTRSRTKQWDSLIVT